MQGSSYIDSELKAKPELSLEYIIAPPRMALYMEYSTRIYNIYLKYIAPEDIHVYSIDEVFMDVTDYLQTYKLTPHELAMKMIQEVLQETGITATAGIGTNLYLCKVAMDIVAKHTPADKDGVRIAELDEMSYRKLLWSHTPLTDFWRIGQGTAKKLESIYIHTMGELADYSLRNEDKLFKMFGVNAELIEIKVSDDELALIRKKAEQSKLTVTAYVRKISAFGEIKIIDMEAFHELTRAVNIFGSNVNQIAKVANSTGKLDKKDIDEVIRNQELVPSSFDDYYKKLMPKTV